VPGAVVIVIVLLLFPVIAIIGFLFVAAILGQTLWKDGEVRNEGSELVDLNI
jgi:hypothetical protein